MGSKVVVIFNFLSTSHDKTIIWSSMYILVLCWSKIVLIISEPCNKNTLYIYRATFRKIMIYKD